MSGFGFFFWRILLLPVTAPFWFIVGYVVSYFRTGFSGFWWFVFYASGPFLILPLLWHLLFFVVVFFDVYFRYDETLADLIDQATLSEGQAAPPAPVRARAAPPSQPTMPRNDCVYCAHEHGFLPNGETGRWCLHFNEAILQTARGYDIYARDGLNAYPDHSGRAQNRQEKCHGFVLSDLQRETWIKRFR